MKRFKLISGILFVFTLLFIASGCNSAEASDKGSKPASLQYLGHSAFVITDSTDIVLGIDLYAKGAFKYSEDLPQDLGFNEENNIKYVVRTHSHVDHSYVPKGAENIRDISSDKPYSLGKMLITNYETEHYPLGTVYGHKYNNCTLIVTDGVRILHMGDAFGTMNDKKMLNELKKQVGNVDILMLPVGNYEYNPTDFESIKNTLDTLAPHITVPVHYWSVSAKEDFLNKIKEAGYNVVNMENNVKSIGREAVSNAKDKTVWSMKPGPYVKQ